MHILTNNLVGKREEKRSVERPRCRWKNNIKVDLKEAVYEGVCRFHLAQDGVK
jgi:hypothetical protein